VRWRRWRARNPAQTSGQSSMMRLARQQGTTWRIFRKR